MPTNNLKLSSFKNTQCTNVIGEIWFRVSIALIVNIIK